MSARDRHGSGRRQGIQSLRASLSVGAGTVLGVGSLALASYNPLWDWLDVPVEMRSAIATGASVLFVILGFLYAFYTNHAALSTDLQNDMIELSSEMRRTIPSLTLFTVCTGEEAFHRISNLLPHAQVALNTRIFQDDYNPDDNPGFVRWDAEIRAAIQRGLNYREVMSSGNRELALARLRSSTGAVGQYKASILRYPLPSFSNFTVFHLRDMSKEVWFGWLISRGSGFEGAVVRTTESHVVEFFEQWHRDLFAHGEPVTEPRVPAQGPTPGATPDAA